MINLNRIRSLKTLEEMKSDLTEFINNPIMLIIYKEEEEFGGEEGYMDDKEDAVDLLEKVEHRIQSLGKFLARQESSTPAVTA